MKKVFQIICIGVIGFTWIACGPRTARSTSSKILAEEVESSGCLSMELLLERLKAFSSGTSARIHSRDIQVRAETSVRARFIPLAARGAFKFEDGMLNDLISNDLMVHFESARQKDCNSVSLLNDQGNTETYQITRSSKTSLTMEQADQGRVIEITLLPPRAVTLHLVYSSIDTCNTEKKAAIDTRQVITWYDPTESKANEELVSRSMLKLLSTALVAVPSEIARIVEREGDADEMVSVEGLKALREAELNIDTLSCYGGGLVAPAPPPVPIDD